MEIERYLLNKGIKPHFKGFEQLVYAIELCSKDKTYLRGVTKRLYPEIANDLSFTISSVERALRFAIKSAGYDQTPTEFIARSVIELKLAKNARGRISAC